MKYKSESWQSNRKAQPANYIDSVIAYDGVRPSGGVRSPFIRRSRDIQDELLFS